MKILSFLEGNNRGTFLLQHGVIKTLLKLSFVEVIFFSYDCDILAQFFPLLKTNDLFWFCKIMTGAFFYDSKTAVTENNIRVYPMKLSLGPTFVASALSPFLQAQS